MHFQGKKKVRTRERKKKKKKKKVGKRERGKEGKKMKVPVVDIIPPFLGKSVHVTWTPSWGSASIHFRYNEDKTGQHSI